MSFERSLTVKADGQEVPGLRHIRLTGRLRQTLYPYPCCLRIWNPEEQLEPLLRRSSFLEVVQDATCIACGEIVDVFRETVEEGTLLTVTFALGFIFWNTNVSLSVPAGMTASDTVRHLLAAGGNQMQLLTDPAEDPVFSRGQTFFGRLPDAIRSVLSACGVEPYLVRAGIALRPAGEPAMETVLDLDSVSGPWIHEEILT